MKCESYFRKLFLCVAFLLIGNDALAWDPVKQLTGKNLTNLLKDKADKAARATEKFIDDPVGYAFSLPKSVLADICSAPIQYYEGTLAGQASGRWRNLPPLLIQVVQPYYVNDLSGVRYAEGIRTSNGEAQTFGKLLYFPRNLNLMSAQDMYWMLHELEHTSQYAGSNEATKLCEYMAKSIGSGLQHDDIDWERAADRKADHVIDVAMQAVYTAVLAKNEFVIQNDTDRAVWFDVQSAANDWMSFKVQPNTQELFTSNAPTDSWFNIQITSGSGTVGRRIDGGTVQRIVVSSGGTYDFYQPR
jgi:hypothetical protein